MEKFSNSLLWNFDEPQGKRKKKLPSSLKSSRKKWKEKLLKFRKKIQIQTQLRSSFSLIILK
jgi:hypothetical protein